MYRGYVKLWRKVLDAGWFKQHKLFVFWNWCLVKASHKEIDIMVGTQTVHLMPGDFIFGLHAASGELDMTIQTIRTIIDQLRKRQNLTIKTTNKFSVISIVNWDIYQSEEDSNNKQINKQLTSNQQATNNKQECKEHKNEKKVNIYSPDFLSFWDCYPKKSGSKKSAWDNWIKQNGDRPGIDIIIAAIESQKEWRDTASSGEFRPEWKDPERWIKGKMWEAETKEGGKSKWFK